MLISDNLYQDALVAPFQNENVSDLCVVTGFSKPAMVSRHFTDLNDKNFNLKIVIGMGTMSLGEHQAYRRLMINSYPGRFKCHYYAQEGKVHSKVYQWSNNENNDISFIGSANYSQNGLIKTNQKELLYRLAQDENEKIKKYINSILNQSILCTDPAADALVRKKETLPHPREAEEPGLPNGGAVELPPYNGYPGIRISFLDRNGNVPRRSGLNWGQRPELNRAPNQAYIRIPAVVQRMKFFPPRYSHFIMQDRVDENMIFLSVVAQDNGKAIESSENNELIGIYVRERLDVKLGDPVTLEDCQHYGKTYLDFYKVDDETYIFNF